MAHMWPQNPTFGDPSEGVVWEALRAQLRDCDVLMHGVRINDPEDGEVEIDLLVLMPDAGACVIEVKGGHITFANGEIRQSGADGVKAIDPAGQAAKGVRALQRYMENQPAWSRGRVKATWLVSFPYMHNASGFGPKLTKELVIGDEELSSIGQIVADRMWDPRVQAGVPASGWVESALEALLGTWDSAGEVQARAAQRLRHVDQLTAEQAALLSVVRMVPRFEVIGSAGTGKTWMAMEQARRWAEAGERVCLVTYTRGVSESMGRAMGELPADQRPAFIGTFFQLGFQSGVHAHGNDDPEFWTTRGPAEIQAAGAAVPDGSRFTAFVVDEAQDFGDSWWPALFAFGTPDFKLGVLRDDEQAVFAERKGRPDLDLVPLVLDRNLRNSAQIVETFRPLITAHVVVAGGDGLPVEFIPCQPGEELEAADDAVASLLEERGWLPEHVALLTTKSRHPVQRELEADKAAYWAGYWENEDAFYCTVSGFKGLERAAVVLAVNGFHDGLDPRNVLYAGMSRARDLLIVVGSRQMIEAAADHALVRALNRAAR